MTHDLDVEGPSIRTRGPIRTRGTSPAPEAAPPGAIIRSRGNVPGYAPVSLRTLLARLRHEVGGLPLVVMVHDPANQSALEFLAALTGELHADDALWLWTRGRDVAASARPSDIDVVVLDTTRDPDRRAYGNLVADLVFFSGSAAADLEMLPLWRGRVRALVIGGRDAFSAALTAGATTMGSFVYAWIGGVLTEQEGR